MLYLSLSYSAQNNGGSSKTLSVSLEISDLSQTTSCKCMHLVLLSFVVLLTLTSFKAVCLFLLLLQTLDDELLRNHTKVLLRSDASDRIWKVKLDGNRLAGGWEEFAAVHSFSEGDVLAFRHDGEEIFRVAVSGESDDNESDDTDDSESDESDDVEDEDNDEGKLFDMFYFWV